MSTVIDIQNGVIIYKRSRLNKPILDYVKDGRSQQSSGDPHSSVYISNRVDLKNPATSLKLLISFNREATADFRAFYQLVRADGTETELSYTAFPGLVILMIQMEMVLETELLINLRIVVNQMLSFLLV